MGRYADLRHPDSRRTPSSRHWNLQAAAPGGLSNTPRTCADRAVAAGLRSRTPEAAADESSCQRRRVGQQVSGTWLEFVVSRRIQHFVAGGVDDAEIGREPARWVQTRIVLPQQRVDAQLVRMVGERAHLSCTRPAVLSVYPNSAPRMPMTLKKMMIPTRTTAIKIKIRNQKQLAVTLSHYDHLWRWWGCLTHSGVSLSVF
jgi:hypothetical protein